MRNTTENGGDCGKLESRCKSPKVFKFKKIMFKYHVCVCGGRIKYMCRAISAIPGLYQYFISLVDISLLFRISFWPTLS